MDGQVLQTLSKKLGITTSSTVRKAEELLRLLAVQCGAGLTLSTSAKTVICLEIAAISAGATYDKNLAKKLSGLTRPQYVSSSQTVNRLLKVSPNVRVSDLCIAHSATNAKDLAHRVIQEYEHGLKNKNEVDLLLPVFQSAAVLAACTVMKIKVDKRKLFESSCSKRAVYTKVVEAMTKIAESLHTKPVKAGSKRTKTLMDLVEENLQGSSPPKRNKCDQESNELQNDEEVDGQQETDFEAWKKRILEAAAASE